MEAQMISAIMALAKQGHCTVNDGMPDIHHDSVMLGGMSKQF